MTNEVILSILGSIGTMLLGLIAWGIKELVTAVFSNTQELKTLSQRLQDFAHESNDKFDDLTKDVAILNQWKIEQDKLK